MTACRLVCVFVQCVPRFFWLGLLSWFWMVSSVLWFFVSCFVWWFVCLFAVRVLIDDRMCAHVFAYQCVDVLLCSKVLVLSISLITTGLRCRRVFVHLSMFDHELSDWFQQLREDVSSRRGVVFPVPGIHAKESELRERKERAQENHGGHASMVTSVVGWNGIRCVCAGRMFRWNRSRRSLWILQRWSSEPQGRRCTKSCSERQHNSGWFRGARIKRFWSLVPCRQLIRAQ